jgi:hypothetical protein
MKKRYKYLLIMLIIIFFSTALITVNIAYSSSKRSQFRVIVNIEDIGKFNRYNSYELPWKIKNFIRYPFQIKTDNPLVDFIFISRRTTFFIFEKKGRKEISLEKLKIGDKIDVLIVGYTTFGGNVNEAIEVNLVK